MLLRLTYRARYEYERPVSFSPHLLRVFPRAEAGRTARRWKFRTNAGAEVQHRRDAFDNPFARCFLPRPARALSFALDATLDIRETNPFHFLLDPPISALPWRYTPAERHRLSPWLRDPSPGAEEHAGTLPFWPSPPDGADTVATLTSLLRAVNDGIAYERREEGTAQTPAETLRRGAGACRDTARLLCAVLRELGLAARLVSGYLWEPSDSPAARRAEGAFHAWTEAYLPGAGWVGLDGTNGVWCGPSFIACAVGLTSEDITPVLGSYFSPVPVRADMKATVHIEQVG